METKGTGWGAFGAYSLSGALPSEKPLAQIEARMAELFAAGASETGERAAEIRILRDRWRELARTIYTNLSPWESVLIARHPRRPLVTDYIYRVVHDFCELHGDRVAGNDPAVVTGFGRLGSHRVLVVGHNRGKEVSERIACNFGCAHPEGYRKALSKMKLAAKYRIPIVSLIDTPGAFPGVGAEERGIASAIAVNLFEIPRLRVPIVSVVIGEGGSGGALGIGIADRVAMMEHSVFSVISPEGCAAILWKTGTFAREAAAALRLRAADLLKLGLIDEIIPEPLGGAHRNPAQAALEMERFLTRALDKLCAQPIETLVESRFQRLRTAGGFFSASAETTRDPVPLRLPELNSPSTQRAAS